MDKILFGVKLNEARAVVTSRMGILTSGMSGVSVQLEYGSEWQTLIKTAVFRAGDVTKDVLNIGRLVKIPHEVLANHGLILQMGVYGVDESGNMEFPTVWVSLGVIHPGTEPSNDESLQSTPPVWAQLLQILLAAQKAGAILPTGGQEGFALCKASDKDFDVAWLKVNAEGVPGPKGDPGQKGEQGVGIESIIKTSANGYVDTYTITYTDGTKSTFTVSNGSPGLPGKPGKDGTSPIVSVSDITGGHRITITDETGTKNIDVMDGEPGKTPVVGEDYFTAQDKAEIAKQAAELVEIPPVDLTGYAKTEDIPKKPEDIGAQPAGNYATVDQLPAVPVQSVNGKTGAVSLSAADVKARPDNWIPTAQDVGARPNTWIPTAQEVGALPDTYTPPNQTAEQVGADPKGTADTAVSQHNTSADSHNDIRLALKAINDRLTAFFDSDDATLDELSEIVAYITSNKTLIEAITTSKVSVSDIVNNLTTNAANKPLSAAQGVVLKGLIDAVSNSLSNYALKSEIPKKLSQLDNDAGYLTQHQDISGKLDRTELPSAINTALAQAAESGEFDGEDGRGIKSIVRTAGNGAAGTTDTYTITYTDNTTSTLTVYNGKDGETPIKGVDYFTEADKAEIVAAVLDGIQYPVFGVVDENNSVVLTGTLPDGTYAIKYEMEDGSFVEVGTLTVGNGESVVIINLLESAVGATGAVLNDVGYIDGYYLSGSASVSGNNSYMGTDGACFVTGFMPYTEEQIKAETPIYIKGVAIDKTSSHVRMCCYPSYNYSTYQDPLKLNSGYISVEELGTNYYKITPVNVSGILDTAFPNMDVAYVRFSLNGSGAGVIITVGQEIPD